MDTIMIIRDSVATCVYKTAITCQPCVKEAGTTWQDVAIVFLICSTLVIIALYAICRYYRCKKDESDASVALAKVKRDNDVKDREWKLRVDKEAHELKRKEEKEDHELKRNEEKEDHEKKLEEEQKAHRLKREEEEEDYNKRQKEEQEDYNKKQRSDLQDKLLSYYKDRLIKNIKDEYNEENCQNYVEQLTNMINELK